MSSVNGYSPVSRAPRRAFGETVATPSALRRPALTKRRVIDLMRVGRSSCRLRP